MKMKPEEIQAVQNSVQRNQGRREDAAGTRLRNRGGGALDGQAAMGVG
jgi:hypothetical protein